MGLHQMFVQKSALMASFVIFSLCLIVQSYGKVERGWMSGNTLLAKCLESQNHECIGYIEGVLDMYNFIEEAEEMNLKKPGNRPFCIPDAVTLQQLIDTVVQFLKNHPAQRHHDAASELAGAFMEGFPCPQ
jgi:hypothetical protein